MKILFLITLFSSQIQNNHSILDSAKIARAKGHFDLAIDYANKASSNFKDNNNWKSYIQSELLKAVVYTNDKNDFDSAFLIYENAIDVGTENLGSRNISIAQLENDLGALYSIVGDLENALIHYEQALQICLETIGPKHSSTALVLDNIGLIYLKRKIYNKAQEYSSKALKIRIEKLGEMSQYTSTSYLNTGLSFFYTDLKKSLPYLKKALNIRKELFGSDSYRYASILRNLTDYYLENTEIDSASATAKEALRIYKDYYGLDNISTLSAVMDLSDVMRLKNKLIEADSLSNLIIHFYETSNIENSELLGRAYLSLAKSSMIEREYTKSHSNLRKALKANRYQSPDIGSPHGHTHFSNDIIDTELYFRILKTFIYHYVDALENQFTDDWKPLIDHLGIFIDNVKQLNDPLLISGSHKNNAEKQWNNVSGYVLAFLHENNGKQYKMRCILYSLKVKVLS